MHVHIPNTPLEAKPRQNRLPSHTRSAPKLNAHELLQFTQQISTLLQAGITLPDAMKIFRQGQQRQSSLTLLASVERDLSRGHSFAAAITTFPTSFDALYLRLIAAGESSGTLEQTFIHLADLLLRKRQLQQKVRTALIHPLAISAVACVVTALLLIKVVPEFQHMFGQFGHDLPTITLKVIALSDQLRHHGHYWSLGLISSGYLLRRATLHHAASQLFVHRAILRVPVIGTIATDACVARFARTLSTSYAAGLPITDALGYAATAPGNLLFTQAVRQAGVAIDQGADLQSALDKTKLFPDLLVHMIGVGEQAGMLDTMLQRAAAYYEDRFDNAIDRLIPLLEPAMMVALGGLIGGLMLAMYLPLFQMGSVLS